jgi:hypothetical protein
MKNIKLGAANQSLHSETIEQGGSQQSRLRGSDLRRADCVGQIWLKKNILISRINLQTFPIQTAHIIGHTTSFLKKDAGINTYFQWDEKLILKLLRYAENSLSARFILNDYSRANGRQPGN